MARIIALPRTVTYPPLPYNALDTAIMGDGPCWYVRMNDQSAPSIVEEQGNVDFDNVVGSDFTYRNPAPGGFAIDTQVIGNYMYASLAGVCYGGSLDSFELVMRRGGDPTGNEEWMCAAGNSVALGVDAPTGNLLIRHAPNQPVPVQQIDTGRDVCTYGWHHIMVSYTFTTPTTFSVWVDGVKTTHPSVTGVGAGSLSPILFNRWDDTFPYTPINIKTFEGSLAAVAWYRVFEIDDTIAAAHYAAYASL